jgi:hypothetical protein
MRLAGRKPEAFEAARVAWWMEARAGSLEEREGAARDGRGSAGEREGAVRNRGGSRWKWGRPFRTHGGSLQERWIMRGLGWVFRHPRIYRWSLALARRLQRRLASGRQPWLASGAQPCTVGGSPPETPSGPAPGTASGVQPWDVSGRQPWLAGGAQPETPYGSSPDTSGGSQGIVADPGWIRNLPGYAAGWTLGRDVPPLPPRSFREWWEEDRRSLTRLP